MKLTSEYCATCNYRSIAAAIARDIEYKSGIKAGLIHSYKAGAFEVIFNGKEIFSKLRLNRFPLTEEILALIGQEELSGGD